MTPTAVTDVAARGLPLDLPDLRAKSLAEIAAMSKDGHDPVERVRRRIAPAEDGGRVLLVAASFNSAI